MTPDELRAIRERCEATTLGPWENHNVALFFNVGWVAHGPVALSRDAAEVDAAFIAHARAEVPRLLDEVERLTRERDAARTELLTLSAWHPHSAVGMLRLVEAEKERDEARAEVERLKRELQVERCGVRPIDDLLQRVTTDRDELHVAWKREREEVERLTRERDGARDRILEYTDALVERDAEIASLTAALDERDREAERVREQYDALATERDEARAIANAAVRELNDANARACIADQLSGKPGGFEP